MEALRLVSDGHQERIHCGAGRSRSSVVYVERRNDVGDWIFEGRGKMAYYGGVMRYLLCDDFTYSRSLNMGDVEQWRVTKVEEGKGKAEDEEKAEDGEKAEDKERAEDEEAEGMVIQGLAARLQELLNLMVEGKEKAEGKGKGEGETKGKEKAEGEIEGMAEGKGKTEEKKGKNTNGGDKRGTDPGNRADYWDEELV
jgi:hypothetical protein